MNLQSTYHAVAGDAAEQCATSPAVFAGVPLDFSFSKTPPAKAPRKVPSSAAPSAGGKRAKKQPGGALDFLVTVRAEMNPVGVDFLDLVRVLAHNPKAAALGAADPLRSRVWALMHATGASSKFVLRKLASAVLPGRGKAKQVCVRVCRVPSPIQLL